MYARFNVLKRIVQNLNQTKSYSQLVRFQSSTSSYTTNTYQNLNSLTANSRNNEDIFFDLTTDYNRKRFVRNDVLTNAIQNISNDISERLSLLILTAAARCVHNVTPEKRVELLEEAWKTLNDKNVRLTARHYETYLSGLNENGFIFDADHYLKLIDKEQIQATPRLYSLLLTQYCREGNTDRAQNFLKMLKERNMSIDEDIFAALIVCQLKLGNDKGANDIIQIMKERGLQPTISTYQQILTTLISEHKLQQFEYYFGELESHQHQTSSSSSSTVYIDVHFLTILLGQCIAYKERAIFDLLFQTLKQFDCKHIPNNLFNLAIQCVNNDWHQSAIDFLQIQSQKQLTTDEQTPYQGIHDRQWIVFFQQLFANNHLNLIDTYFKLMLQQNLLPLDSILHVQYTTSIDNYHSPLNYLEHAQQSKHPMRINYFYPLLIHTYSTKTSHLWSSNERLHLFRLLNHLTVSIDSFTYTRLIQKLFHQFYQNHFQEFFQQLFNENCQTILDRFQRLLLIDIEQKFLPINILEQIAPYFRLNLRTKQDEFSRHIYQILIQYSSKSKQSIEINDDFTMIYQSIEKIATNLLTKLPTLKIEIYINLIRHAAQHRQTNLIHQLARQCIQENIQINRSINEIDLLTVYALPRHIVEQLTRYKQGEMSWNERLISFDLQRTNQMKLEQIYDEAKQDGKYPSHLQKRLLDIYIEKKFVQQAFALLHEMDFNRVKLDSSTFHRLFHLITVKINDRKSKLDTNSYDDFKYLHDIYDKSNKTNNLPTDLTFRLSHTYLIHGDQENALKLIANKINSIYNNEINEYLMKFLRINSSLLTIDTLKSIGNLILNFRINPSIRKFWDLFFDRFLQQSTSQDLVQYYSQAMKTNNNIPYLHLFQLFIENDELNYLQDIVDIATLEHGPHNVLHDLAFILIEKGKLKQAEKIFQTHWLKARNDRIQLHAFMFADTNNLDALINAIRLTKNIAQVNRKPLFNSAIRVAIHLNKFDVIDSLIKEIQDNRIQLDSRVKKYLDAYLLSKGLDRVQISNDKTGNQTTIDSISEKNEVDEQRIMAAQN